MAEDYTVDNLAIEIEASADKGILSMEKLLGVTEKVESALEKLSNNVNKANSGYKELIQTSGVLSGDNETLLKTFKDMQSEVAKTKTEVSGLAKELDGIGNKKLPALDTGKTKDVSSGFNTLFNVGKIMLAYKATKKLIDTTVGGTIEMTQSYNLLNVAMDKNIDKAMEFQNTLTSNLGVNLGDSMKTQGYFMSLTQNMNIASDSAYKMSENLTKLVYDLSSLYNLDPNKIYSKLQSGMIGQTKPLRELGIDVTAQTLQGYINDFGWETQIQQMSQAEKVMLRYIAILDQSKMAHGNLALAIDAPANQLRIFSQVTREASAWIGTVFLGALGNAMSYANAFMMVVRDVAKSIASLFGFKLNNFGFGRSTASDLLPIASGIGDIDTGLGNVAKSAKQAKTALLTLHGFEDINNITKPTEPSSASGGGSVGGIGNLGAGSYYDDLVGKLGEYDNLMNGINNKTQMLRQKLLDWLGFQYEINKITGELENIRFGGFSEMNTSAKLLLGSLGSIVALKLLDKTKNLVKFAVSGAGSVISPITKITDGLAKTLGINLQLTGVVGRLGDALKGSFSKDGIGGVVNATKEFWNLESSATKATLGLGVFAGGTALAISGAKDLAKEGELTTGSIIKLTGGMAGATAGGAMLGSIIPGVGTAVGAVAGFALGAVSSFNAWNKQMEITRYEASLFTGIGVPIEDYTRQVVNSIDATTGAYEEIHNYNEAHKKSKNEIENVVGGLDTLYTKLSSNVYDVTEKDIEDLNTAFSKIASEVEKSGDAFVTSTLLIAEKLKTEGRISTEQADTVVANAKRKAKAEGDYAKAMQIELADLTEQYKNGVISQEDFEKRSSELTRELVKQVDTVTEAKDSLKVYQDQAKRQIDLKNWVATRQSVGDVTKAYTDGITKLNEYEKSSKEVINELISDAKRRLAEEERVSGKTSEAYKAIVKELENYQEVSTELSNSVAEDNQQIELTTVNALGMILSEMHSTGIALKGEAKEISEDMIATLEAMGYQVNFKDGAVSSIQNAKGDIVANYGEVGSSAGKALEREANKGVDNTVKYANTSKPTVTIGVDKAGGERTLSTWINSIWNTKANITVGLKSDGKQLGIYGNGGYNYGQQVSLYADGGMPDVGEIYIARESGNELLGRIGSQNAVMNNDQIVSSVARGVASAVSSVLGTKSNNNGTQVINLNLPNGDKFASWVIDEIDNLAVTTGKTLQTV